MMLDKDSIGYWTFNCEELLISIKTKEYQELNYALEDANKLINFGKNIGLEPISFNLDTITKFEFFSFSFNEYYRIFIDFKRVKKTVK